MAGEKIVIVGAARTPIGGFMGDLSSATSSELGARAIAGAIENAGIAAEDVEEVVMGCVLQAGQGQAPARQASLGAGISASTGCTTVNKMCGSGMKASMLAHDQLIARSNEVMVAGGMESMSNAPYLIDKARGGVRLGNADVSDHMFTDGLQDPFGSGGLMGAFAEDCAEHYQFTREAQDAFAVRSLTRAALAIDDGTFDKETVPVTVKTRKAEVLVKHDEQPRLARPEKIPLLKPAFREGGTVTAANSSSISDGAAALVMMRESVARQRELPPRASIVGHATFAAAPQWFTTAPIGAVNALLDKIGWQLEQVDLFEVNEAFAVVTMAAMRALDLSADIVNVHGGACALGHPIGASGARIVVTLLNALERHDLRRGVATLCIGGGEATAIAIERVRA